MTITKEKLNLFVVCAKGYLNANTEKKSVLTAYLDEILPSMIKKLKKVEREKELVRLKYAKKTASKHIEQDKNGRYQFTEEDNINVLEEFDRIDEETIEIEPMLVPEEDCPQDLTFDVSDAFRGIVIPEKEDLKLLLEKLKTKAKEPAQTPNDN